MNDKNDGEEKDKAYYLQKIKELKKRKNADNAKPAFIVQENDDEFGRVHVRLTDSEDNEAHRPTQGKCIVTKAEGFEYEEKCFMVNNYVSEKLQTIASI